jgi:hypothetical protein
MAMTYSGKISTAKSCPVGVWTTIVPTLSFPAGGHVHALLYVNVSGRLSAGRTSGAFDVRALRAGTTDDTACETRSADAVTAGGAFTNFVTLTWLGANPGGFTWQIRPRVGIASLQVNTRYAKGLT